MDSEHFVDCTAPLRLVCFDTLVLCAERQHCDVEKASNGTEKAIRAKKKKIIRHIIRLHAMISVIALHYAICCVVTVM